MSRNKKYPTIYESLMDNPFWQEWEKVAHKYNYDVTETRDCGWLSASHLEAFLKFVKNENIKNNEEKVLLDILQ